MINIRFCNYTESDRVCLYKTRRKMRMNKNCIRYITGLLLFGTNGFVASHIALSSGEIVLLRTGIGSIALLILFLLTGHHLGLRTMNKRDLLMTAGAGVALGMSWILLFEAYRLIGVGTASLAYYCGPIIVVALSPVVFHEKISTRAYKCCARVILGMLLTNIRNIAGPGFSVSSFRGLMLGIGAAFMYAVMVICSRKAAGVEGFKRSTLQMVFAFLTVLVCMGTTCRSAVPGAAGSVSDIFPASLSECFWILVLGLVNTGVGCYLYFSTVSVLPVRTVSIVGYLEPLSAVIFSAVLLQETFGISEAAGAVLIITGAMLMEKRSGEHSSEYSEKLTAG